MAEVLVCAGEELKQGDARTVYLGKDVQGLPIVAILLRNSTGGLVALRNLCRHLPVPLDGGTGELLTEDRRHLICGTHGALYRIDDGYCVEGPCEGLSLERLACRETNDGVYVSTGSDV
ncbi:MAG: Rieske 2Fe-2S domain-containing protein [Polyangiales bacterium]